MKLREYKTVADRRKALEKELGVSLGHIGQYSLDEAVASTRNCENMIGVAQVPMGVAGPLTILNSQFAISNGKKQVQRYYIPLATTEGALVASVSRGCKAITESGGATVDSSRVGATRGPAFRVENLAENNRLHAFLDEHFDKLVVVAQKTSQHIRLVKCMSEGVGKHRFIRFVFDTQDAMGMNMATIASTALISYIEEQTGLHCVTVSGNYCVDKKPAWLNIVEGRGIKAWAEVTLSASVLRDVLKTTAKSVYDVWMAKCVMGSAMSGSMSMNAQYANVVAALFLATGQDLGHIGEASLGITTAEVAGDDIYISVYLPDLMVGTVGGGMALATQKEALSLLGVAGGNEGKNSQLFAEIVSGAVLAGEISLLSSLASGTLACAHEALARGKHN